VTPRRSASGSPRPKTRRLRVEAERRQATSKTTLTRQQVQELIEECADISADLRDADPGDMASVYGKLGLRLTYHPERRLVSAAASPQPRDIGKWFVSEGGLHPNPNACSPESSQLRAGHDRGRGLRPP